MTGVRSYDDVCMATGVRGDGGSVGLAYMIRWAATLATAAALTACTVGTAESTSDSASLVTIAPPLINDSSPDIAVVAGQPAVFSVQASGTPPLAYQWFRDSLALNGADRPTFVIATTQHSDSGGVFYVIVSNLGGATRSAPAHLSVTGGAGR